MPFFAQYNLFGANVYMCYDYVHLDNLSDISAYRNHIVQLCKKQIHNFRSYVSFTGFTFYIAVRCGFDKHLYLTSCLNAHNHNTCIRLPQTGCTARKMALFIISQDRQTQVQVGDAMATTITID